MIVLYSQEFINLLNKISKEKQKYYTFVLNQQIELNTFIEIMFELDLLHNSNIHYYNTIDASRT